MSRAHAQFMAAEFTRLGFSADYLEGRHDQAHRAAVMARLKASDLQVVFSVDVLGEGIDAPDVDTLLLLRPTKSPVLFAQQLGRGLRTSSGKTTCLVLDFIGQHRAEYRFQERFRALINPARGSLRTQAEQEFPFLPAGCSLTLERVARERVLARLKEVTPGAGLKFLKKDLLRTQPKSLAAFLETTERTVEQLYAADQRKMSWTRLRRAVGRSDVPAEPSDPELRQQEADLLKRIGFLQHVTDPTRIDAWTSWLSRTTPPISDELSIAESRLAMQLMHLLEMTLAQPRVRLCEAMAPRLSPHRDQRVAGPHPRSPGTTVSRIVGLDQVPLMAHAR